MSSRFKGIFDTAKETEVETTEKPVRKIKPKVIKQSSTIVTIAEKRTRKKGSGKSSNPEYTQALAYVRKNTLDKVKEKLFFDPTQDFSDLTEALLVQWLENN
jgi:hypothetical protein